MTGMAEIATIPRFLQKIQTYRNRMFAFAFWRRPMPQERRRTPRYPFAASIEMREQSATDKITARVTELGLNGCYVDTINVFREGTSLGVKVFTNREFFEAQATVIFSRPEHGMGLMFREVKPYYVGVLRRWLLAAMMGKKGTPG
jgi:PilZ domain-containing protein